MLLLQRLQLILRFEAVGVEAVLLHALSIGRHGTLILAFELDIIIGVVIVDKLL